MPAGEKEEGKKGNSYGDSIAHDWEDFRRLSNWASEKIFETGKDDWFAPIDL